MNRVSLVGRIVRDPEPRYSQNGTAILNFSLAVDRGTRDASGQRQADFINCVAFGQPADFMLRYVKKGYMMAVCGRLQVRSYQGQDGQNHTVTEVICEAVENLTPRDNTQPAANENVNAPRPQYPNNQYQSNNNQYSGYNNPSYSQNEQPSYRPQNLQQGAPAQPESFDVSGASEVSDDDLPF